MKNLVIDIRSILNISQVRLAEKLGVTQGAIAKYESGDRIPSLKTLKKILESAKEAGLNVDMKTVLSDIDIH